MGLAYFILFARNASSIFRDEVIDVVTVLEAILTSRQLREKLQCLYENLTSNNFRKPGKKKKKKKKKKKYIYIYIYTAVFKNVFIWRDI